MTEQAAPPDADAVLRPDDSAPDLSGNTEMRRLHPLTPLLKSWVVVAAGIGYVSSQLTGIAMKQ